MYNTAGHRQKQRTKHNPQATQNPPTEAQKKKKKTQTLKLTNMEICSLKK
jgi:hypothetical protein